MLLGILLAGLAGTASAAGLLALTPEALALRGQTGSQPVILDVRSAEEFAQGHVPGAIWVPHDGIEEHWDVIEPLMHREIIVYCRSGRRAELAEATLRQRGVTNLRHLGGDWQAWIARQLPVETTLETGS